MRRLPLPAALERGIVAVLRAPSADRLLPVCRTLVEHGVVGIELTLTTPGVLDALPAVRAALPDAVVGLGTITTVDEVHAAATAGATFGVSPVASPSLVAVARERRLPFVCGALTPTEVHAAWSSGASAVKVFPAGTVGSGYLGQLRGPFPDQLLMPSGGVGIEDIPEWLAAGAAAVSLGGDLQGSVFVDGDLAALAGRAERASALRASVLA